MGEESAGLPNRVPVGWYVAEMDRRGYRAEVLATNLIGPEGELERFTPLDATPIDDRSRQLLADVRGMLRPRFRAYSDVDLAVSGFFLLATKPT
jgi:hypothetical protein